MNELIHTFQVLIPYRNRPDLTPVLTSLLQSDRVHSILVIGDPAPASSDHRIQHLPLEVMPFSKAVYLNGGLQTTSPGFVLISDADIIWNLETLVAFTHCLHQQPDAVVYVAAVAETQLSTAALQRPRWQVTVTQTAQQYRLAIVPDQRLLERRPGYGLIAAHRDTLLAMGGYNESLQGWGWEDQDLLLRAQLLGHPVYAMGTVLHLSHGDSLRNQGRPDSPERSRNRNLLISIRAIAGGDVYGSIPTQHQPPKLSKPVLLVLPPELQGQADEGSKISCP